MNIEIINNQEGIPSNFFIWARTDLICPICKKEGLVIKYRWNGKIGFFHESSGIILGCENWGNCKSWWNKGEEDRFPWHTWLSSFHRRLDFERGSYGQRFLNELKETNKEIYDKLIWVDNKIQENTK